MIQKWYFDRGASHLAFFKPFLNLFLLNFYLIQLILVPICRLFLDQLKWNIARASNPKP